MSIKKFDNSDDNITSSDIKYILDVNKKAIEIYLAVEQQNEELQREVAESKEKTKVLNKLFTELGKKYQSRPGGYSRIVKLGSRDGDNGLRVIFALC